jgi:hypothetical protein
MKVPYSSTEKAARFGAAFSVVGERITSGALLSWPSSSSSLLLSFSLP